MSMGKVTRSEFKVKQMYSLIDYCEQNPEPLWDFLHGGGKDLRSVKTYHWGMDSAGDSRRGEEENLYKEKPLRTY